MSVTTPENYSGFIGLLFRYPNEQLMGGLLGNLLLVVIFIIAFMGGMERTTLQKSYLAASFLTMTTAIFFLVFGLIGEIAMMASAVLLLAGMGLIWR
jgi:hypothetical protein